MLLTLTTQEKKSVGLKSFKTLFQLVVYKILIYYVAGKIFKLNGMFMLSK